MEYIVQPVLEKGANHPTFKVNNPGKKYVLGHVKSRQVLAANSGVLTHRPWSDSNGPTWKIEEDPGHEEYYYITDLATDQRLAVDSLSDRAQLKLEPRADIPTQKWVLTRMGGAKYGIKTASADLVIDINTDSNDQTFRLRPNAHEDPENIDQMKEYEGRHFLLAEVQSNALTQTFGKTVSLHTSANYDGNRRDVALGKYDNGVPGERLWRLRNIGSRHVLGLNYEPNGPHPDWAQAVGWLAAYWRQIFRIEPVPGTAYYRIIEVETGYVLAPDPETSGPGTDVKGFDPQTNPAGDLWELRPLQGCFLIVNKDRNLAMEHYRKDNEEWVELQEVSPGRGDLQRWAIEDETTWEADTTKEYKIRNPRANKWLYALSGTELRAGAWEDTSRQIWRLTRRGTDDGWQVYSVASAAFPSSALSMPNVANEQPLALGGANSEWHVIQVNNGAFRLRVKKDDPSVRYDMTTQGPDDTNGLVIAYQETWNEHAGNQEWELADVRDCTVQPGKRYLILSDTGFALTDEPGADASHGVVTERPTENRPEQMWRFEHGATPNEYFVVNAHTSRVLEVQDGGMNDGATVRSSSSRTQRWRPSYLGPNKYTLIAHHSNKALDGTTNAVDCKIHQWTQTDVPQQKWRLVEMHDGRVISPEGIVPLDFSPLAIKSLRIPTGVRVTLYSGPHLTGESRVLVGDTSDIGTFTVVSLLVEPLTTLWTATGEAGRLGVGEYTTKALSDLGIPTAGLTRIEVPQGMQVEVFNEDDFYGDQRVLYDNAPPLAEAGVTTVKSIRVKAAGVVVPAEALRYGDVITLRSQNPETYQLTVDTNSVNMVAWGQGGGNDQTKFRIVRAGPTRFKDLVCYGDVVGLESLVAFDRPRYVWIGEHRETKYDIENCQEDISRFTLVRAAATTSRTFVSRGDVLAFFQSKHNLYLSADRFDKNKTQALKAADHLMAWEGWKIEYVWPLNTGTGTQSAALDPASASTQSAPVDGSPTARSAPVEDGTAPLEEGSGQDRAGKGKGAARAGQGRGATVRADRAREGRLDREGQRVAAVEPALSSDVLAGSFRSRFSPLRFTGPRALAELSEEGPLPCGVDACGAAACFADGGMLSVCGAAATGIGFCGVDIAAIGVCGVAAALQAVCGADVSGVGLCAVAASGVAVCGVDACGAAACGAAACGGAACGAAACGANAGNGVCGVDTCSVDGSVISACPADICAANACLINLCPADACAADACLIDLIPIIPGI